MEDSTTDNASQQRACVETLAAQLYREHHAFLQSIARRNSANADDADDALQEALVCFIQAYDPQAESPALPWLILTLKRQCWSMARRSARQNGRARQPGDADCGRDDQVEFVDQRRGPEELVELSGQVADVGSRLAALKPDQRRALVLLGLGYSYREIGEITGWTRSKINRCMVEGRSRLRQAASSSGDD